MKTVHILLIAILLQACNQSEKLPDAIPENQETESMTVTNHDTVSTVFSPEEEAQIKKDSLIRVKKVFPYMAKYSFNDYKAPLFTGKPAAPDFKGNPYADDPEYTAFITKGCKRGINFGGHYTVFEKGCGVFCEQLFMVDRRNGKIFTGTMGLKKVDGYYGFAYKKDSCLLIANSGTTIDASHDELDEFSMVLKPELFVWKNEAFVQLE